MYGIQTPVFEARRKFDFSEQPLTGTHRPDGILIMHGARSRPGPRFGEARLIDLAPTILTLLDLPVPAGLDGAILEGALTADRGLAARAPINSVAPEAEHEYTSEDAEKIMHAFARFGVFLA